ncbi:MAG: hypothetical protein AAB341_00655 [Planctomycetota bacterium]
MQPLSELCAALPAADRFSGRAISAAFDASVMSDAGRPLGGAPASQAHLHSSRIIPLPLGTVKDDGVKDDAIRDREIKDGTALLDRIEGFAGLQRAFLKVQDGCDAFCTYCIIPRFRPVGLMRGDSETASCPFAWSTIRAALIGRPQDSLTRS